MAKAKKAAQNDDSSQGKLFIEEGGGTGYTNSAMAIMAKWLKSKYEFRRDMVKPRLLFREVNSTDHFEQMEDEDLNTMCVDADLSGLRSAKPPNILMYLNSRHVTAINPIVEYLHKVSVKRPVGAIKKLCGFIKTSNDDLFFKYFRKWLASSVANVMQPLGCQNHTCMTLTGGQGAGKTTLIEWLCPPELEEFMYTGEVDLKSKDTLWMLAEYWFINLEEQIKALNRADANTMKALITRPDVRGRKPYGRMEAHGYRIANFLASTNDDDFINDHTGSRRYLCFRIMGIDLAYKKIKIDEVWAEAYHFYKEHPNDYYVTSSDFDELMENNKQFVNTTPEQEYVSHYFSIPGKDSDYHLLTATAIRDFISLDTGNKIVHEKKIGNALRANGFEQISYRFQNSQFPQKVWKVQFNTTANLGGLERYRAHANNQFKP